MMKFRLKKTDDAIELERFLKAVKADEDYQKIRFMIKDGLINVNGEKEYARRRLLFIGDTVSFKEDFYLICSYKENEPIDVIRKKKMAEEQDSSYIGHKPPEKIIHHRKPLSWSQKYNKDK